MSFIKKKKIEEAAAAKKTAVADAEEAAAAKKTAVVDAEEVATAKKTAVVDAVEAVTEKTEVADAEEVAAVEVSVAGAGEAAVGVEDVVGFYTKLFRNPTAEGFKETDAMKAAEFFTKYYNMLDKGADSEGMVVIVDDIGGGRRGK